MFGGYNDNKLSNIKTGFIFIANNDLTERNYFNVLYQFYALK